MDHEIARFLLTIAAGLLLLSAGIEDVHNREIANRKSVTLIALAPAWWWANRMGWGDGAIQVALAAGIFALFVAAFHFGMMGGGDVKLISALALWLPPVPLMTMLTIMALAGGAVTLAMLVERAARGWGRAGELPPVEVPYGVAIAIAGMLVLREPILNQFG